MRASSLVYRQPADEVGEEDVRRCLQLGVLVQEEVELPRLVADPEVVRVLAHDVVEEHEVRDQDLVHLADRLEDMQLVLAAARLDVRRLVREAAGRRMDRLARRLEHGRHRVLREPVDLELGTPRPQLADDRQVALRVAEADRARDEERAGMRRLAGAAPVGAAEELLDQEVDLDRGAACGPWPGARQALRAAPRSPRRTPRRPRPG